MPKRLFVGIKLEPSAQLLSAYHKLQENLQTERIKWVSEQNLHITLKFLGEINGQFLPEIYAAIKTAVDGLEPFEILIKGIGKFSKKKHASVIWLGIEDRSNILASAAAALNKTFSPLGIGIEQKIFKPHLTLGRIKYMHNEYVLDDLVTNHASQEFQKTNIEEIILFESILKSKRPVYLPLKRIKLER